MKQLLQSLRNGELALVDVPEPALQPGYVLVRNAASVISPGTERMAHELAGKSLLGKARERPDLVRRTIEKARREGVGATFHAVRSKLDTPVPVGYSTAGVVIAVGEGASEFTVGDRVACAGAGYAVHAEVVSVPRNLVVEVPTERRSQPTRRSADEEVPLEEAAFTTVGAIALQGVRVSDARIGEIVVVVGLGLIGLLTIQLLSGAGCLVLGMDLDPDRCRLAEDLGCEKAVTSGTKLKEFVDAATDGAGADAVIVTAASKTSQPVELAAAVSREKGRVVVVGAVGMELPRTPFYEKELELRLSRSYGPGRYDPAYEEKGIDYPYGYVRWTERRNMAAFLGLLAGGRINVRALISHTFPIDEALKAYETITDDESRAALGVVLTYPALKERPRPSVGPSHVREETREASLPLRSTRTSGVTLGVIGGGQFAKSILLPLLKQINGVRMAILCTGTGISASGTAKQFGFSSATTQVDDILSNEEIDAVCIATRHNLHADLVVRALESGKHVFVEKPLALDLEQLQRVATAYRRQPNVLLAGFNRRFAPSLQSLKGSFDNRSEPITVMYRVNAGPLPRDSWIHDPDVGGGRIVGEVCHFVDCLQYLIGQGPTEVFAKAQGRGSRYAPEDNVTIIMSFPDGSVGTIHYLANGEGSIAKERVEVFGEGAVGSIDDYRTGFLVRNGKRTKLVSGLRAKQDKGHDAELRAFISAVGGTGLPFSPEASFVTMLGTFAIRDSLRLGSAVPVQSLH